MDATPMETRLALLENRLRWQQSLTLISLVIAVAALGWSWHSSCHGNGNAIATSNGTVEAQHFILRDANGLKRGVWEVDSGGFAALQIAPPASQGIYLGEAGAGSTLNIYNGPGSSSMLTVNPDGAGLTLRGPGVDYGRFSTKTGCVLRSDQGELGMGPGIEKAGIPGSPWMTFTKDGKPRVALGKSFDTGNQWRLRFTNSDTSIFYEVPNPPGPP